MPTGEHRTVTAATDQDLFWALRGGGGDFGIVTAMEIRLLPGFHLYGGRLLWPVEKMPEVLRAFREVTASAPDKLTLWYHTYQFPPMPEIPEEIRGKAFASVAVAHLGSAEEAEELLAPLRAVDGVVMDLMGPVRMADLGGIADEPVDPMPSMEHSMLLDDLERPADRPAHLRGRREQRLAPGRPPGPAPRRGLPASRRRPRRLRHPRPALPVVRAGRAGDA